MEVETTEVQRMFAAKYIYDLEFELLKSKKILSSSSQGSSVGKIVFLKLNLHENRLLFNHRPVFWKKKLYIDVYLTFICIDQIYYLS